MNKKEIERKFLIKFPTSWENLSELFEDLVDIKRIEQTYLKPKGDEPAARVRKTIEGLSNDLKTIYHYNKKKPIETAVEQELEKEITRKTVSTIFKRCLSGEG